MSGSSRLLVFVKLWVTTSMESCVACLIIGFCVLSVEALERCGFPVSLLWTKLICHFHSQELCHNNFCLKQF